MKSIKPYNLSVHGVWKNMSLFSASSTLLRFVRLVLKGKSELLKIVHPFSILMTQLIMPIDVLQSLMINN